MNILLFLIDFPNLTCGSGTAPQFWASPSGPAWDLSKDCGLNLRLLSLSLLPASFLWFFRHLFQDLIYLGWLYHLSSKQRHFWKRKEAQLKSHWGNRPDCHFTWPRTWVLHAAWLFTVWCWESWLTFLCHTFLYKIGLMVIPRRARYYEEERSEYMGSIYNGDSYMVIIKCI